MKRIISVFLCIVMSISVLTPMATATNAGLHNFKDMGAYRKGQFNDVVSGAWYEKNVEQAYNLDLMTGNSAYTFNPTGNITQVEALVITARMHKIYATGNDDFSDIKREMHSMRPQILEWCNNNENNPAYKEFFSAWYAPYAYYLYSRVWPEGRGEYPQFPALAFDSEYAPFIDTKTPITRARFVSYLIGALPESEFKQVNNIPDGAIPDVEYDPDVYLLYRAGVLSGSDVSGKFNPSSYITRAEVAAIIARMVVEETRIEFSSFGTSIEEPKDVLNGNSSVINKVGKNISADTRTLNINVGDSAKFMVTTYEDGVTVSVNYDSAYVDISWGEWDGYKVPVVVHALREGQSQLELFIEEYPSERIYIDVLSEDNGGYNDNSYNPSQTSPNSTRQPISAPTNDKYAPFGFEQNWVNGIELCWTARNNSGRTINYYTVRVYFYNPVGDPAYDELTGLPYRDVKYVGPAEPGRDILIFSTVGYVPACDKVVLGEITLEYNDGTSEEFWYGWTANQLN